MREQSYQQIIDEEHLKLLRIAYFIHGGITGLYGLFGLTYAGMGSFFVAVARHMPGKTDEVPPEFIGWMFAAIGGLIVVIGLGYAALSFLTARAIGQRRSRILCLITAGVSCVSYPFGTLLGVCTLIVFSRPSVQALFGAPPLTWYPPEGPPMAPIDREREP